MPIPISANGEKKKSCKLSMLWAYAGTGMLSVPAITASKRLFIATYCQRFGITVRRNPNILLKLPR